jgi:phospholipid transport system substrate-binding protein
MRTTAPLILIAVLAAPPAVHAQSADPAAAEISRLDEGLLSTMRDGKRLGPKGRFEKLEPIITGVFDLPTMTRYAVGPTWAMLSPADKQALVSAFTRMTVATYAHNFDDYSGEKFVLDPKVETRGPDKLVRTQIVSTGSPTTLAYRMRQSGGAWRVIDVYFNGSVSSLQGQRSEYAATLKSGGAPALTKKLNARAEELLRSS